MQNKYQKIVFLTGAGISAESGLSTFRAENGLWNRHRVEDVATIEAFERNPHFVHDFYNDLRKELFKAEPNSAHLAITKLQENFSGEVYVITQNVDTLHEKAGNKNVFHIHGKVDELVCLNCGHVYQTWGEASFDDVCPNCSLSGFIKPNIVFFGENLLYMDKVEVLLKKASLFVSVGTSGMVYPAAGFVQTAKYYGAKTIDINIENLGFNPYFDRKMLGRASVKLSELVDELLSEGMCHRGVC